MKLLYKLFVFSIFALFFIPTVSESFAQYEEYVEIDEDGFWPYQISVPTGTKVIWENYDTDAHMIASGSPEDSNFGSQFQSDYIWQGNWFYVTFNQPGTFEYFCALHPWEEGEVFVYSTEKKESDTPSQAGGPAKSNAKEAFNRGDYAEAIRLYNIILLSHPQDVESLYYLGIAYGNSKDYKVAIDYLKKADDVVPNDAAILKHLGWAHFWTEDYSVAKSYLEKALKKDSKDYFTNYYYGRTMDKLEKYSEARDGFKKALAAKPGTAEVTRYLGLVDLKLEKYGEAIEVFDDLVKQDYKYASLAYASSGYAYQKLQDNDDAVEYYLKALKINPKYTYVYNQLCPLYLNSQMHADAIKCFDQALAADPNNQVARDGKIKANALAKVETPKPTTPSPVTPSPVTPTQPSSTTKIPTWMKGPVGFWSEGKTSDAEFRDSIQFMIKEGFIVVPATAVSESDLQTSIPGWIKGLAGFWSEGKTSDSEFANGLTYLISKGIIVV